VEETSWWTIRRAQSNRPATYRCPFCGELLHAMSEHVVIAPEGDVDRRRHAHMNCVHAERAAGRFKLYDDVRSRRAPRRSLTKLARWLGRPPKPEA
jgi:muramidase (phage lysozyme)